MKILILGDVMGSSGRLALKKDLAKIINENQINFSVINGEMPQMMAEELHRK